MQKIDEKFTFKQKKCVSTFEEMNSVCVKFLYYEFNFLLVNIHASLRTEVDNGIL